MIYEFSNVKININDALEYLETLSRDYQQYQFSNKDFQEYGDLKNIKYPGAKHSTDLTYSWAINRPTYNDIVNSELEEKFLNTKTAFGFGERVLNFFPMGWMFGLYVSPPGTTFIPHKDGRDDIKVYIPIKSNDKVIMYAENYKDGYNIKQGVPFILDSSYIHSSVNEGTSNRAVICFKCKTTDMGKLLDLNGTI